MPPIRPAPVRHVPIRWPVPPAAPEGSSARAREPVAGAETWVKGPLGFSYERAAQGLASALAPPGSATPPARLGEVPSPSGALPVLATAAGTIGLGRTPRTLAEEISSLVAWALSETGNRLGGTSDPGVVRAVGRRVATLYSMLALNPDVTATQARAACLAVLSDAAARARELGEDGLHRELASLLANRLESEQDHDLRSFADAQVARAVQDGKLPGLAPRTEALFPGRPPYAAWEKDGRIRMHFVVDDDGTKHERVKAHLEAMGFSARELPDGTVRLTRPGRGRALPIEIHLAPKPEAAERPRIFDAIASDETDVIVYSGHAGYGQNVREALARGVSASGEGKLVVLYQCSGALNSNDIRQAFPKVQFSSTTAPTNDGLDEPMFEELIAGFDRRASWPDIQARVQRRLTQVAPSRDLAGHYFFPHSLAVQDSDLDRDNDGTADALDSVYHFTTESRTPPRAVGVDGVAPSHAAVHLAAPGFVRACGEVALVLRNNRFLASDESTAATAREVIAAGTFEPEPGETRAFRFTWSETNKRLEVRLSTHFAGAGEGALGAMLAAETALFVAGQAGLAAADRTGLVLAMSERWAHQTLLPRLSHLVGLESDLVLWRYGLRTTFTRVLEQTGNPDELTPARLAKLAGWATAQGLAARGPAPLTRPLSADRDGLLDPGLLPGTVAMSADRLAAALGVSGRLYELVGLWSPSSSSQTAAYLLERDGRLTLLEASLDGHSDLARILVHETPGAVVVDSLLDRVEANPFLAGDARRMRDALGAARASGRTDLEALAQAELVCLVEDGGILPGLPLGPGVALLSRASRLVETRVGGSTGVSDEEVERLRRDVVLAGWTATGGPRERWLTMAYLVADRVPDTIVWGALYHRVALARALLDPLPEAFHDRAAITRRLMDRLRLTAEDLRA